MNEQELLISHIFKKSQATRIISDTSDKKIRKTWKKMTEEIDSRYHKKMRRSRAARNLKKIKV